MTVKKFARLFAYTALTTSTCLLLAAGPAKADTTTDLLRQLVNKGVLSQSEYQALLRDHRREEGRGGHAMAGGGGSASAEAAASAAAASAAAAQAAAQKAEAAANDPLIVRAKSATPDNGAWTGVGFRVGNVDITIQGIVNGFYTYDSPARGPAIAGGLANTGGHDSSSVRSGLLPNALIIKAATTYNGIDVSGVFGFYPGIDSSSTAIGANSGGLPIGLGTPGIDARQGFLTFGTPAAGTVKIGRDLGIFGSDAILSDVTLLGVGGALGNAAPGNTSLGRIGLGYIYADFMPQISYASPIFAGFQVTAGVFQPLNELNFSGLSSSATAHNIPMFQGKVTYDYKFGPASGRIWTGFVVQPQEGVTPLVGTRTTDVTALAGEVGAKVAIGPFGAVGYYYRGTGVGTTALMFDGIAPNGRARGSEGFYAQVSVKPLPKLQLAASYGTSNLYQAAGENDPTLVARNQAIIGGAYYSLTNWLTLVAEYTHLKTTSHSSLTNEDNSVAAGGIIFF